MLRCAAIAQTCSEQVTYAVVAWNGRMLQVCSDMGEDRRFQTCSELVQVEGKLFQNVFGVNFTKRMDQLFFSVRTLHSIVEHQQKKEVASIPPVFDRLQFLHTASDQKTGGVEGLGVRLQEKGALSIFPSCYAQLVSMAFIAGIFPEQH